MVADVARRSIILGARAMKAILEYDLPHDQYEFDCAITATAMRRALRETFYYLRDQKKHNAHKTRDSAELTFETVADFMEGIEIP